MANLFISFPGTNNYLECTYYLKEKESASVRFVQEAIIHTLCKDWGEKDRLLFFTTKDAYNKNWLDNGFEQTPVEGLETRIKSLGLPCSVENVMIPEAKSENEIWDIFQIIIDKINDRDDIILDITHAFRSIPTLAVIILNYAKTVKSSEIKGIYYGAFEVLGSINDAKQLPVNERKVQLFDLTAFESLLEWSFAVSQFVNSGDASIINRLSQKAVKPILKATKGGDIEASAFRDLGNKMEQFTSGLATCRGMEITPRTEELKNAVQKCKGLDLIKPFVPLMGILENELKAFCGDDVKDGIKAAEWCLKHNLIQQGYTILQESLITYFVKILGMEPYDRKNRQLISSGINVICKELPLEHWDTTLRNNSNVMLGLKNLVMKNYELAKLFQKITPKRNNLNHAGLAKEKISSDKFRAELVNFIKKTSDCIK